MKHRLHKLQINKVALVDAGAGKGVRVQLFKRRDGKPVRKEATMTLEELMAAVAALSDEDKAKLAASLAKADEPTPEQKAEAEKQAAVAKVKKAAEEAARTEIEKARAETAELRKKFEESERKQAHAALLSRVEKSMRGLEGKPEDIAADLMAISDEALREKMTKRFEADSTSRVELLKKSGMLKAIGSTRAGEPIAPAAEFDELVAKAMKDEGIKSKSDAVAAIAKRRPDLYAKASEAAQGKVA